MKTYLVGVKVFKAHYLEVETIAESEEDAIEVALEDAETGSSDNTPSEVIDTEIYYIKESGQNENT